MYRLVRPLLFALSPETAHKASLMALRGLGTVPALGNLIAGVQKPAEDAVELFGLRFRNRLGLAAGYDKDALAWRGLAALGFGHVEIGTVTPQPQTGNPRPRLFRLVDDNALINRLGFPSAGAGAVARRLQAQRPAGLVLGVNIGINKTTPIENAAHDYALLMQTFSPLADYITINVSSPNTTGLRNLQSKAYLHALLKDLAAYRSKPLLIKLSPDLNERELDEALEVILAHKIDGVIATNTTISRPPIALRQAGEAGGLSGRPLTALARKVIGRIYTRTEGKLPIIAAGGIMSGEDADAAINAGASLVQIYSGLVYRGPGLIKEILERE
jgi:dihydroorotate dehydrogenase